MDFLASFKSSEFTEIISKYTNRAGRLIEPQIVVRSILHD